MGRTHRYEVGVSWTGDTGSGYRAYDRGHAVTAPGKPVIAGSADPAFRGSAHRWNPEELLVASLSQCHMLWFLGLCAQAGIAVVGYTDHASGTMDEAADGSGAFEEVTLRPAVTVADPARADEATALHATAEQLCFIARSVDFPVRCEPTTSSPIPMRPGTTPVAPASAGRPTTSR